MNARRPRPFVVAGARHPLRDTARAMSQADIETLRLGYEAANRGDWNGVFTDVHPAFELVES